MPRIIPTIGLLLLLFSLSANALERSLLVLGDSLSAAYGIPREAGWVQLLERRLAALRPPWRLVNASISGETTAGGLTRLPRLLERHRPRLVIIELGSNDGLRGLSLARMEENLHAMIGLARARGARVLLVGGRLPPNYGEAYATAFRQGFQALAESEQVALVPFLLAGVAGDAGGRLPPPGRGPTTAAGECLAQARGPAGG